MKRVSEEAPENAWPVFTGPDRRDLNACYRRESRLNPNQVETTERDWPRIICFGSLGNRYRTLIEPMLVPRCKPPRVPISACAWRDGQHDIPDVVSAFRGFRTGELSGAEKIE